MLGLKLPSDPRWVNIAKNNLQEILSDHAYCEQKAANSAISLVISFPEKSELVSVMLDIAKEEISHFQMVHKLILEMGFSFGRERKDVGEFYKNKNILNSGYNISIPKKFEDSEGIELQIFNKKKWKTVLELNRKELTLSKTDFKLFCRFLNML